MFFNPLHIFFLVVLLVMSVGASMHLAFTGQSVSLAVALASWSVFLAACMFVVVNAVVRHWFTSCIELAPPVQRQTDDEIKLIGAHAVANAAGRYCDRCAFLSSAQYGSEIAKAIQSYGATLSGDPSVSASASYSFSGAPARD